MSRETVETLIDRWMNEPSFRADLRADPQGAVTRSGVELSEEEWEALRSFDWSLSDEQLEVRTNMMPIV